MDMVLIIIASTVAFGVPLMLVALGGMFTERSGVINIALEGIMVFGGLFGTLFLRLMIGSAFIENSPHLVVFIGMLIAMVSGFFFSMFLAYASIHLKADQIIGGTALNIFAPAFAIMLTWAIQGQGMTDIVMPEIVAMNASSFGLNPETIPAWLNELLSRKMFLTTPFSIVILLMSFIVLYKTKFGLRLRSCGEHPSAADSVGVRVILMRYIGVGISGALAGLGGYAFVMASSNSTFTADVAGYGFLGLAVMIFANWRPFRIMFGALFFSLFKTISAIATQYSHIFPTFGLNKADNLYAMLPYIITIVVLAFTSQKSRAPKAEGMPYDPST